MVIMDVGCMLVNLIFHVNIVSSHMIQFFEKKLNTIFLVKSRVIKSVSYDFLDHPTDVSKLHGKALNLDFMNGMP